MSWILLAIAIIAELCGTTALKYSDGFTKPMTAIFSVVSYVISFYLLSIIFRSLPVGIVYAIWSGVGIIFTAVIAFFAFGQKPDLPTIIGIALIIAGVVVINLFSNTSH